MNLLLLSNSTNAGEPYLGWCHHHIAAFLMGCENIVFIPYAGVTISPDSYEANVQGGLKDSSLPIRSIHHASDPVQAIEECDAIVIGGGNSYVLLDTLYKNGLMEAIQKKVNEGAKYVGWSAGSNVAGLGINTTNDMPIVYPPSFDGLALFPYLINPHFTDKTIEGHGGESRMQRLLEYKEIGEYEVMTMEEGSGVLVDGESFTVVGENKVSIVEDNNLRELMFRKEYSLVDCT